MSVLGGLPRPFIVGVVVEDAPGSIGPAVRRVADEGCHAAEINLTSLPEVGLDPWAEDAAVPWPIPVYTSARRRAFMSAYGLEEDRLPEPDDEGRMRWQLQLLEVGSVALDLELDTFAPDPAPPPGSDAAARLAATQGPARELTDAASAVARQRSVIAEAHDRGGEVIASCHTGTRQTTEDLLRIVETAAERGADRAKVVAPCPTIEDLLDLLRATARLAERGTIPFTLVGAGACGGLSRYIGGHLGSGWSFARSPGERWGFAEQPTAREIGQVLDAIGWRYPEVVR